MMLLVAALSLFGHVAIATVVINRLHAVGLPSWCLKTIDALWCLWLLLAPLGWLIYILQPESLERTWPVVLLPVCLFHLVFCAIATVSLVPGWIHRAMTRQTTHLQLSNDTKVVSMVDELGLRPCGTASARLLSYLPGNEIFRLHVNEKRLVIPRLPAQLDGLTITHLSDLHYTGQLTEGFHHEVVRRANALESDLIAITGDLIDKRDCMDWLGDILGQLRARHGVYFILGNHDVRVRDEFGVRNALTSQGLVDLGRRWTQITIHGQRIILAGNELPWFVPAANMSDCPPAGMADSPIRILLSHSPDQYPWARVHDFDLMLAGHTHGGQIQVPGLGPVLIPSRFGVRYASGSFFEPPTVMHVSRGISGTRQIRINSPPELTQLVLVAERKPTGLSAADPHVATDDAEC